MFPGLGGTGFQWTYDNWGANPGATIGTAVTPGTVNAQGSWTQIASSANIGQNVHGFYMQVLLGAASALAKPQLLDIGIDEAGGTSYTPIIQNMQIGMSPSLTQAGAREHFFPFFIKAGSSVAVRVRGANASTTALRVAMRFYGLPTNPENIRSATYAETLGANTATSLGTSVTPGNAADGSWVGLGTITKASWWWQLGYCINNGTVTAEYTYLELAWGDASNKHSIFKVMHGGTTGESCGLAAQTQILWHAAYQRVPAGINIYVRARCNNAPDTGYNVTVTGLGGN